MSNLNELYLPLVQELHWYVTLSDKGYRLCVAAERPEGTIVGPYDSPEDAIESLYLNVQETSGSGRVLTYLMFFISLTTASLVGFFLGSL